MKRLAFAASLLATLNVAAEVEITSFDLNGTITWTNSQMPSICHVEGTSNLMSQWSRPWADLTNIAVTTACHSAAVPIPAAGALFCRIVCETGDFQDGLALYMPFDGNTDDLSTNQTDGVNTGATLTSDKDGNPTNAYFFDGSGTQIYVPDTESLDVTNIALAFWFRPSALAQYNNLVNKIGGNGNISFGSHIGDPSSTDKVCFRICTDGTLGTLTDLYSTNSVAVDEWHHFCGTYDGSQMNLYLDGHLNSSVNKTGDIYLSSEALRVGAYSYFAGWYFNGTIDEVMLWSRALLPAEVKLLYLNGGRP